MNNAASAGPAGAFHTNGTTGKVPNAPTTDQVTAAKLVYGLLSDSRYAYRPRALDDALSREILEGYLEPGERLPEGPFGDHTGFYTPVEPFPVLHIEAMTMRKKPIYHSIITSKPRVSSLG